MRAPQSGQYRAPDGGRRRTASIAVPEVCRRRGRSSSPVPRPLHKRDSSWCGSVARARSRVKVAPDRERDCCGQRPGTPGRASRRRRGCPRAHPRSRSRCSGRRSRAPAPLEITLGVVVERALGQPDGHRGPAAICRASCGDRGHQLLGRARRGSRCPAAAPPAASISSPVKISSAALAMPTTRGRK